MANRNANIDAISSTQFEDPPAKRADSSTPRNLSAKNNVGTTEGSFDHVILPEPFENRRRDPVLPCYSVGNLEQNLNFFGRENELAMIDHAILPHEDPTSWAQRPLRSFGICGMGGIGKTQIAIQYIFTRRRYFDAIFWLHAGDKNSLAAGFASIARQLGIEEESEAQDLIVSRERVKAWLSDPLKTFDNPAAPDNEASWLVVFDNVDELSVLDEYWPLTGQGSILLTSRDPDAKANFYTENVGIDVSKLSVDDTMTCIRSLTKYTDDSDSGHSLRLIAEMLDGHFLGINQISGIIRRLRITYADFLQLYQRESKNVHGMLSDRTHTKYYHSLATVWFLQQFSQSTESLLQVLSMLDPDAIPETLLLRQIGQLQLEAFPGDLTTYYDSRRELLGASLVELLNSHQDNKNEIKLHRLLQDVVVAKMDQNRHLQVLGAALDLVSAAWPFQDLLQRHKRERWDRCAALYLHVAQLKETAEKFDLTQHEDFNILKLSQLMNDTGWYVHEAGSNLSLMSYRYLFERGSIPEAQKYFVFVEKVFAASAQTKTPAMQEVIRECHNNQGTLANESNNAQSALYHYGIWMDLSLRRRADNGNIVQDYELGLVYHESGIAHAFNEEWGVAIDYFMRCWKIWENLEGFKETMLLWPVSNLGYVYCELGRLEEAEKMLLYYLQVQADEAGVDDTESFR